MRETSMTSRERVIRTIRFEQPDHFPWALPEPFGDDFAGVGMTPSPDARPNGKEAVDEWGGVWHNIGLCGLGEVKEFPLKEWADFDRLSIPDITEERRWSQLADARAKAGDKFLIAYGVSLYERAHFVRGLENLWVDIHAERQNLEKLLDILMEMNLYAIEHYAKAGADGYMWCDDWGLQDRLMINPQAWRELWKPRYARVYKAAHEAGLLTLLHSCGHIVSILDDLIEAGLDVIQMDQQQNMGLDLLGERFGGRITFWCPVDIQNTMAHGTIEEIRDYCGQLVRSLGRPTGGFIAKWYPDPVGAGHRQECIEAMASEFCSLAGVTV